MSSLVIWFIAMIAVIIPSNNVVDSARSSAVDINKIVELLQKQRQNLGFDKLRSLKLRQDSSDSDSLSSSDYYLSELDDSSDSDNNRLASLRKERIIDLIEKVASEKNNKVRNNDRAVHRKRKPNYDLNTLIRNDVTNNKKVGSQLLDNIIPKAVIEEDRRVKPTGPKKRLKPNPLTINKVSANDLNEYYKNDDPAGLEDYSKVYIVLNPQAVRKSKHKDSLNELISKVLSLSSPIAKKDHKIKRKPRRYKGFVVNDDHQLRRFIRDSKEMYAPRDSMGNDYAQKRSRNSANAAGGRTAIPYIRHGADIYERDN